MIAPERRTRADMATACVIAVVVLVVAAIVWWRSDFRQAESAVAETPIPPVEPADSTPSAVNELWSAPNVGSVVPVAVGGTVVGSQAGAVIGHDAATGEPRWRYERQRELCGIAARDDYVVAVYRTRRGCSQVTTLNAATGERGQQRSSDADLNVELTADGSYVMSQGPERLEVWRSDMVRTLEFGRVAAPVNPNSQPRAGCDIIDALLHRTRVAALLQCPHDAAERLVLLDATPERHSHPEEFGSSLITTRDGTLGAVPTARNTHLAALTAQYAAVYAPGEAGGDLVTYGSDAAEINRWPLDSVPVPRNVEGDGVLHVLPGAATAVFVHPPADVAYWFTGTDVVAVSARDLRPLWRIPGATGIPDIMAGKLLVPVAEGIAVHHPRTGEREHVIIVDRGDESAAAIKVLGEYIVEQRDRTLAVLGPAE